MADLEDRLSRELRSRAGEAPGAEGLAVAARSRLRRRRTASVVVAAVVLAVVAVPVGLAALGGGGNAPGPADLPSAKATLYPDDGYRPAPDGWRWETGDGLQALVPDSWGYGVDVQSPCNRQLDAGASGAVEVPGVHTLVGCTGPEAVTHYVSMLRFSADPGTPARETVGRWTTRVVRLGGLAVTVRSDDPAVLARIVASVSAVGDTDSNGCPATHPALADHGWRPHVLAVGSDEAPDVVTVCRYGSVDTTDPGLTFSTVLSDRRASDVMVDLLSAPAGTGPDTPAHCVTEAAWGDSVAVVRARFREGWQEYVVRFDGCVHHGTDDGTTKRELTREVARAVLIGYRGGVQTAVYRLAGDWMRDNTR